MLYNFKLKTYLLLLGKSQENTRTPKEPKPVTEIEKTKQNPTIKKSPPLSESQFHEKMQHIDECIFIRDSSSDEEFDVNDSNDISQEEILKIIKQEQNASEEETSGPSFVLSDNKANNPTPVADDLDDVEMIEATQNSEKSRLSCLSSKIIESVKNIDRNTRCQELKLSPDENQPANSPSIELFSDEDHEMEQVLVCQSKPVNEQEIVKTTILQHSDGDVGQPSQMSKNSEMIDTVILVDSDDDISQSAVNKSDEVAKKVVLQSDGNGEAQEDRNEHVSEAQSIELFSDSDSDDFIEVVNSYENSACLKENEKQIEIIIDPNKIVEDDIFADIFVSPEIISETSQERSEPQQATKSSHFFQEKQTPCELVQEKKTGREVAQENKPEDTKKEPAKTLAEIFNKVVGIYL